jgi:hypothetical protein
LVWWAGAAAAFLVNTACQRHPSATEVTSLAISGRVNQTPSLAFDRGVLAVSWSAVDPDGTADVYVAVSRDGGTMSVPLRVNDEPGEVRASEQQAPRIALAGDMLAVLWTSRRAGQTQVRVAVSQDQGRTFGASRAVTPDGAPGTRGWGALLIDKDQRIQAVWLDTRIAAASAEPPVSSAKPPAPTEHHMHGANMPSTRQDLYAAVIDPHGAINERLVATNVCFCCKTAIAQTDAGLAAAWRDVYPGSLRDISFARLDDSPEITRVRVAEDGWQINGCPEDGPAMAADPQGHPHVVWPTLVTGEKPAKGVFYAKSADGRTFSPRVRLDDGAGSATHPAVAVASSGVVMAIWEMTPGAEGQDHRIEARAYRGDVWQPVQVLTHGTSASSPAIAATPLGFVLAWGSRLEKGSAIEIIRF